MGLESLHYHLQVRSIAWCPALFTRLSSSSLKFRLLFRLCLGGIIVSAYGGAGLIVTHISSASSKRDSQSLVIEANVTYADSTIGVSVRAVTADPNVPCNGRVTHYRDSRKLRKLTTSDTGGAQWSWRIPHAVRAGQWTARVTCHVQDGRLITKSRTFIAGRGTGPGKRSLLFANATFRARAFDVSSTDQPGGSGAGSDGSLYPIGQCTWWVARNRPDLPYFPHHGGDAKNWPRSAKAAGFPVDGTPTAGDVAVFSEGQSGAGTYGHVAYVKRVVGPTIWISEANFGQRHPGSERPLTWRGAALQFIHHKPDDASSQPSMPPPMASPAPSGPVANQVTIDPPPNGSVQTCYTFTGTAELAPGNTLVLALHNLTNNASATYFTRVDRWLNGTTGKGPWRLQLFFNSDSIGQMVELSVLVMPESAVAGEIAAHDLPPRESAWSDVRAVPPDAERKLDLHLERIPGEVPCA
jgi:surface antigen